ncbi:MAG: hypothetical protein IKC49_02575 [Clostridia bacterium]|nr:hypothetical protein [Clostridia bacterium]
MKKVLKIIIITVLVLGVIAGTCYIFYKNMKPEKDPIVLVDYTKSEAKATFNQGLADVNWYASVDGDSRFDLIITTHDNLDKIMNSLSVYVVADGGKIMDQGVINALNKVTSARSNVQKMINEYKIKTTSQFFNKSLGANDLYEQTSAYLTKYASLVIELNDYVSDLGINTEADVKYNIFDMYARITTDAFDEVDVLDGSKSQIKDSTTIVAINNQFIMNNNFMNVKAPFAKAINDFNEYYSKCNKTEFAKNFATNIATVQAISPESSDEQIATFYFKKICGLGV